MSPVPVRQPSKDVAAVLEPVPTVRPRRRADWRGVDEAVQLAVHQLVREHATVRERTLEITFLESSAEAYASRSVSHRRRHA
ncbi:hypothetical protein [Streptomyces sp. NPDC051219]|uniref:hypothetical protein n=1 Tax=Streptomyces sp. NPDC051219 TaxID=3155283 RepID=UPI00342BC0DA